MYGQDSYFDPSQAYGGSHADQEARRQAHEAAGTLGAEYVNEQLLAARQYGERAHQEAAARAAAEADYARGLQQQPVYYQASGPAPAPQARPAAPRQTVAPSPPPTPPTQEELRRAQQQRQREAAEHAAVQRRREQEERINVVLLIVQIVFLGIAVITFIPGFGRMVTGQGSTGIMWLFIVSAIIGGLARLFHEN